MENAGLKDVAAHFTDPRIGMQNMRPRQKQPTEFETVSRIQTQTKSSRSSDEL